MFDTGAGGERPMRRALAVVLAVVVVGSAATAGVAVGTVGATASTVTSSKTATTSTAEVEFVYVNSSDGNVTLVRSDGSQVDLGVNAELIGPAYDLDGDSDVEVPYVTSNQNLYAIDRNGEKQQLSSDAKKSKAKLAVGDWDGDGNKSVLYANSSSTLYRVEYGGSPTKVANGIGANAALGIANLTSDSEPDLVYVNSNSELEYYNQSAKTEVAFYKSGIGSNNGLGVGAPRDFDRDGTPRVPIVDGSNNGVLVEDSGSYSTMISGGLGKQPIAGLNWTGTAELELLFLDSSTKEIVYGNLSGSTTVVKNANGGSITAKQSAGIAAAHPVDSALDVSNYGISKTGGKNITVSFETNEELSSVNVTVSGAESAELDMNDVSTSDTAAPFTYTGTYDASADGSYSVTLQSATSTDSDVFDTDLSASLTYDTVTPNVTAVSVSDATDGDGEVEPGDTISVTAEVGGDVGTVVADLSNFDAGTVELTHDSGDTYTASASVGSDVSDGDYRASVVARDGQGNNESVATGTLTVDSASLSVSLGGDRTVMEDDQVQFSVASVSNAEGDVSFEWSMGDGGTRTGDSVVYTYVSSGVYTVTVEATDESGATATASVTVTVEADTASGSDEATTTQTTVASETTQQPTRTVATTQRPATTEAPETTQQPTATTAAPTTTQPAPTTTENAAATPAGNQQTPGEAPGFGVVAALVALAAGALLARRE